MTSLNSKDERQRGISWPRIVAMLLVQILVLLALAAAAVGYVEWSSEANRAEFMSATRPSVSDPAHPHSSAPIERVKARAGCDPKVQSTGP